MNLKERVINELKNKNFPDLKFLFSSEVLDLALQIFEEELEKEKEEREVEKEPVGVKRKSNRQEIIEKED